MLSTLVSLISHILSEASLENASKLKRFDDFKTMLSLNDKDEDQEEGLPLKPTQNDFVNEEEEERIPRARSKRARRAPKAVYDNDFEAHEIQNVRVDSFFTSFSSSCFCSLLSRGKDWIFAFDEEDFCRLRLRRPLAVFVVLLRMIVSCCCSCS